MAHELQRTEAVRSDKMRLSLMLAGPAIVVAGLVAGDRLIAETAGRDLHGVAVLSWIVEALDLLSGKHVSNFLLGALLIVLGAGMNVWRRRRLVSGWLMYVGLVQFLTTTIVDLSKPIFGRARPFQAIVEGRWVDQWFAGADFGSFPSGHVAFYVGLCVPIALLHRRFAAPLLLVPGIVALQRLVSHDHYMTDVGASILIGVTVSLLMARLKNWTRSAASGPDHFSNSGHLREGRR